MSARAAWEGRFVAEWRALWRIPDLVILRATTSTNDVAHALAEAGAPEGTVVIADHQTRGRGRAGRAWISPPGMGLLMSIVLGIEPPEAEPNTDLGAAPIRVGLALARAIESAAGTAVRIKWPNDIVLPDGRKLAGILCEAAHSGTAAFVIAGIGVNVAQTETDWTADLRGRAVSLREANGFNHRARLATALVDELRPFRLPAAPLDAGLLAEFERRDAIAGCPITVDGSHTGTASGIDADGALLVTTPYGSRTIRTGTVRIAAAGPEPAERNIPDQRTRP
jgi:BirA family biotin operon repressor/biotin-[acetyl-CoA-carboxylase] ligase